MSAVSTLFVYPRFYWQDTSMGMADDTETALLLLLPANFSKTEDFEVESLSSDEDDDDDKDLFSLLFVKLRAPPLEMKQLTLRGLGLTEPPVLAGVDDKGLGVVGRTASDPAAVASPVGSKLESKSCNRLWAITDGGMLHCLVSDEVEGATAAAASKSNPAALK